jgi:hypothetical protein
VKRWTTISVASGTGEEAEFSLTLAGASVGALPGETDGVDAVLAGVESGRVGGKVAVTIAGSISVASGHFSDGLSVGAPIHDGTAAARQNVRNINKEGDEMPFSRARRGN